MSKELEAFYERKANHKQLKLEKYMRLSKEKLDGVMKHFEEAYIPIEQALKRNEPMKVVTTENKLYLGTLNHECPNCKAYIGFSNQIRKSLELKYCPYCGQALDWSDEK